jgi:hypothetical protein
MPGSLTEHAMPAVLLVFALLVLAACGDDDDVSYGCFNGSCPCYEGEQCVIPCDSPPCHIDCGEGSSCYAECANGSCRCRQGSACEFECFSPPCHVRCDEGTACSGECENGSCTCGADSSCYFACLDSNCGASCGPGSSCVLECVLGRAGDGHCTFDRCDGKREVCDDGVVVCNAPCP